MLASDMNKLAKNSVDNNAKVREYFTKAIEEIRKVAQEGKNEISFYSLSGSHDIDNREFLKKKLELNGFALKRGYEIGKPLYNSESLYVVW